MWNKSKVILPDNNTKVVVIDEMGDICIAGLVLIYSGEDQLYHVLLDAEEGLEYFNTWPMESMWTYLPDNYPIHFMEITEADWY